MAGRIEDRLARYRELTGPLADIAGLMTVQDLGVFEVLREGPLGLEQLAERCTADSARLDPFLRLVARLGFLRSEDGKWALVPGDEELFDPDGPYRVGLGGADVEAVFRRFGRACRVLRGTAAPRGAGSGGEASAQERDRLLRYLDALARPGAEALAAILGGEPFERLADLGCGGGTNSFALLRAAPGSRATLFDRENAAAVVAELAADSGVSERVEFRPADLLHDELGTGFDLVLLSNVTHCFGVEENRRLLGTAAAALKPGGRLAVKDYAVDERPAESMALLRFSAILALSSDRGKLHAEADVAGWLSDAGLACEQSHRLGESFLIVARRSRDADL